MASTWRVPPVEVLGPEGLDVVDVAMSVEDRAGVAGLAEQHAAPVVDELGDVQRPVDLGHLTEHRFQEIVEDDLAVEGDDEVVDV